MSHDDVKAKVQNIFREVFDDPNIVLRDDLTADDVDGWKLARAYQPDHRLGAWPGREVCHGRDLAAEGAGETWGALRGRRVKVEGPEPAISVCSIGFLLVAPPGAGLVCFSESASPFSLPRPRVPRRRCAQQAQLAFGLAVFVVATYAVLRLVEGRPTRAVVLGVVGARDRGVSWCSSGLSSCSGCCRRTSGRSCPR